MASPQHDAEDVRSFNQPDSELPPLPIADDDSFFQQPSDVGNSELRSDGSALMEKEMQRKLMDLESSFLPETTATTDEGVARPGADDTYIFGGAAAQIKDSAKASAKEDASAELESSAITEDSSQIDAPTPSDAYRTPGVRPLSLTAQAGADNLETPANEETSGTEPAPSSPSAAAAERNLSRDVSKSESQGDNALTDEAMESSEIAHPEITPSESASRTVSTTSTAKQLEPNTEDENSGITDDNSGFSMADISAVPTLSNVASTVSSIRVNKRPSYLRNRQSSQRSSLSSFTNRSDASGDAPSDTTLGADYALQSGGAAPAATSRSSFGLSRLPSLGSISSSMSGFSESNPSGEHSRIASGANGRNLDPLDEERPGTAKTATPPQTPRPAIISHPAPTDTIIAQHVQNIRVPDTAAKEYREKHLLSRSPDKKNSLTTPFVSRNKHNLTLKEQNSKIDKLTKENFDLKLKIYYLDEALKSRSDEGVKEMIEKNVQLQTDLANEKKDNVNLRKKVRELERKLKAQEEGAAAARPETSGSDGAKSADSERYLELEEEITYLRECLEHTETQVEKLREENLAKEVDKRRMAEFIKSIGDRSAQETAAGVDEAMEMWKDLLEAETARREQADEDAQRLREELAKLKEERAAERAEAANNNRSSNVRNIYHITKRNQTSYTTRSHSGSDITDSQNGGVSAASTLVEQLRHENAELRRDLGAQTSMLTSRNRERERLQQEIEDLKLSVRRGDGNRSVAGDSIFERSISRAHQRPGSRASGHTRVTQMSDQEREEYESKQAALRDEVAQTKLLNQDLERELNAHLDILTQTEEENRALKEERQLAVEDLQALQSERDEALLALQDKETECENIRDEAIGTIEGLEDEIARKEQELSRLAIDLNNRNEDFMALQQEMKAVSESLVQLEDDKVSNLRKIQSLERDLNDANLELEALEKRLREALSKMERLEVQLESTQDEISFLREEQEGDKIKIGELEASLSTAQSSIQEEKERYRDLEDRFAEERRQREILGTQEKEQVQKVLDDLNLQLSKAREEIRRLRKSLSTKEVEANSSRDRLTELETGLRDALGTLDGTKSNFVKEITKIQKDLDSTVQELETTKHNLAEKERLLKSRDALLESTGLESRRLADLLEKERQSRKQDRQHIEQQQRNHQSVQRSMHQHETRVVELEMARTQDKKKLAQLEQQYRDQLLDRNNLLLALWNRLSTVCGADWAQKHALINGELPSLEVIARNLAGFNKNIILAVKQIENIVGGFRSRVRTIEKDLWKDYQTLEHTLDVRCKRLDQLERMVVTNAKVRATSRSSYSDSTSEIARLKTENLHLKAELQFQRQQNAAAVDSQIPVPSSGTTRDATRNSVAATLLRHQSSSAVETLQQQSSTQTNGNREYIASPPLQPSEQRWIHRLKELERRLKAEREARLLDRSGARKMLQEGRDENKELRLLLEREKERNLALEGGSAGAEDALDVARES